MKKSELRQIIKEELGKLELKESSVNKKQLKNRLNNLLSDLSYIKYDESLKSLDDDAMKLQKEVEDFVKKLD